MKVPQPLVRQFLSVVRDNFPHEIVADDDKKIKVYHGDDIKVVFGVEKNERFIGASFETLGRDFHILSDLELIISEDNEEGEKETFIVTDMGFFNTIVEFLKWRIKTIETLKI